MPFSIPRALVLHQRLPLRQKILFSTLILEAEDNNDIEQNEKKLEFNVNEPQSFGVEALNV